MNSSIKTRIVKIILWMIVLFLALFTFRLIYGYTLNVNSDSDNNTFFESTSQLRNYASKEYKFDKNQGNALSTAVDQKFEKVAEINTKSAKFESEERATRAKVEQLNAIIQFEQKSGNEGNRKLNLVIGVPPQNFDSLYAQLILVGKVQAKRITKNDKTNEYKELNAKKMSLDKTRSSLMELKSKGGKIEEYMDLENRILDIEQQLQDLGVSLGDFDDENEFCTVKFSLLEGKEREISSMHRVKVALEWSVSLYLQMVMSLFFVSLFAVCLLYIVDKLRLIEKIISKK